MSVEPYTPLLIEGTVSCFLTRRSSGTYFCRLTMLARPSAAHDAIPGEAGDEAAVKNTESSLQPFFK